MRFAAISLFTTAVVLGLLLAPPASAAIVSGSFYHSKFVGRPMACGGTYDHEEFTAASNRHPCNTRLLVRRGGRSVVVRVTDRCRRCGIDLSRAAAKEIGLYRVGRAQVSVNVLD